jgi:hypothetical protein
MNLKLSITTVSKYFLIFDKNIKEVEYFIDDYTHSEFMSIKEAVSMVLHYGNKKDIKKLISYYGCKKKLKKIMRKSLFQTGIRILKENFKNSGIDLEKWIKTNYSLGLNPLPELRRKYNISINYCCGGNYPTANDMEVNNAIVYESNGDIFFISGTKRPEGKKYKSNNFVSRYKGEKPKRKILKKKI